MVQGGALVARDDLDGGLAPLITQTPAMGALPTLRAATDPAVLGGQYYGPGGRSEVKGHPRLVTSSPGSYRVAVQQRLWAVSEKLTGVTFPVVQSEQNSSGTQEIQIVVPDAQAAREQVLDAGVEASEVDAQRWGNFVNFRDPDGNSWSLQAIAARPHG